jgi:hypothetical protein
VRAAAVAPTTKWPCDEFYRDVMYCVVKRLCIVLNTMDSRRLYMLKLELPFYIVTLCSYICCEICFGGSPSGEAAKTGLTQKIQYIPRLTEKRITLCSSVNRGI